MDQALISNPIDHPPKPYYTAKEVAYVCNMQPDTIRIYRSPKHRHRLHFIKVGGRYLYPFEAVVAFIQSLPLSKRRRILFQGITE